MGRKTYTRRELPPCPDPDKYILVKTAEGYYWRKKRGSIKKASLNTTLARNINTAKLTGPAASRILRKLEPYTRGLKMGRMTLKIAGLLMKTYHSKGIIDFSLLEGLEMNAAHPLDKLLISPYKVIQEPKLQKIQLEAVQVRRQNKLVTDYYFEAVLLYGNPAKEQELDVDAEDSVLFSFDHKAPDNIEIILPAPPAHPWMLLLKVSCLEGNELAMHPKHYGLKVVKASS